MKQKLLLICVALLCAVGSWAGDITSNLPAIGANWDFSYTNVSGSDDTHQGVNITATDPKGQCADMGTYKFAEVYNGRATGTEFEIYKELSVTNGTYIFQMAAFGRFANMAEEGTTDINGEIFANGATAAVTSGEFVYYTVTTTVTNGTLKVGLRAKSGNRPNWWGYTDYTLVKVDGESDVDLTKLLVNSSFECNSTIGWTLGGNSYDTGVKQSAGTYETNGTDGTYLFNTWWTGVPITQTITDMPNGVYTLTASLASSDDDADGKLYLLAQDGHSDVITIAQGNKGTFNDYNHTFSVTNNSVTVGVVGGNADGTYTENGHWWYKADYFRLKFTARVNLSPETFTSGSSVSANTWYAYTVPANGWYTITSNAAGTFTYTQDGTQTVVAAFPRFYAPTTGKFLYLTAGTFYFKTNTAATVTIAATEISAGDDVTGYINDPSFEHVALNNDSPTSTDLLDWEGTSDASEAFISYKINTRIYSGVDGNNLYNTWGGTPANGFYLKQTLHNQPSGFYKLTCSVASDANASVKVAFGDAYSDVACGTDKTVGHEANVLLYNESAGDVLISLTCANWFKADNFTLTYIGTNPREVLHDAIEDASAYTLGFEDGEYAPYNNVAGITALAAAEATYENGAATIGELYDAATALTGATWTANVGEVNAFYDGSFADEYSHEGNVKPKGWIGGSSHDNATDVRYMWDVSANPGLAATSNNTALFTKYDAYYGKAGNYTMPLKENTIYKLTFKYGTWGTGDDQTRGDGYIQIKDASDNTITIEPSNSLAIANDERGANGNTAKWKNFTGYFFTADAGNYVLELLKTTTRQQNQYAYSDFNLVRATAEEIKLYLNAEITTANGIYNSGANVGSGVFQIPVAAGTAYSEAISAAQSVYNNASATSDEVTDAINALKEAERTYADAELNAPAADKRYYIKVVTPEHAKNNNAVVANLGETSSNNKTGYSFNASARPTVYLAQAFVFEKSSGNDYYVKVDGPEGLVYLTYGSVNGSDAAWAKQQIQGNTDSERKAAYRIIATNVANHFNLYNTVYNDYIACEDGGSIYTNGTQTEFTLAEASQAEVTVSCKAGKYGTVIFPFTPDVSEGFDGIKFYSCTEVNNETNNLLLTEEDSPAANTPYIIKNTNRSDNFSKNLSSWGTANQDRYTTGLLTGVYTAATIPASASNYVLQTHDDGVQAFYSVDAAFTATPYKAFLTHSGGSVKAFGFDIFDAINAIEAAENEKTEIYNLAGQRLNKAQKGVNIINGKKVLVK